VGARRDPFALEHRLLRTGRGRYNVRPFDALSHSFSGLDVQVELLRALPGELLAAFPLSAPDAHFAELADVRHGFELSLGLKPAADDRGNAGILPGQNFRGHTTGRAGSNLPEVVGFEGRKWEAVSGTVKQHLKMRARFRMRGVSLQPEVLRCSRRHVVKHRTSGQNDSPARMIDSAPIGKLVKSMLNQFDRLRHGQARQNILFGKI